MAATLADAGVWVVDAGEGAGEGFGYCVAHGWFVNLFVALGFVFISGMGKGKGKEKLSGGFVRGECRE